MDQIHIGPGHLDKLNGIGQGVSTFDMLRGADGQLDRRNLRLLESDPHEAHYDAGRGLQLGVRHWFYEDFVGHFLVLHAS